MGFFESLNESLLLAFLPSQRFFNKLSFLKLLLQRLGQGRDMARQPQFLGLLAVA